MTLLKIENDKGFYLSSDNSYKELDQIGKDDLLFLINKIINENECQMESLEEKSLKNQAHNIIYKNIYTKLNSFFNRRNEFNDQINQIYKEEYDKYIKFNIFSTHQLTTGVSCGSTSYFRRLFERSDEGAQ